MKSTLANASPEEWDLLSNSIRHPVRQMMVALVESHAQSDELIQAIEAESKASVFYLAFDIRQHAWVPDLHREAANLLHGYDPGADEVPVLCLRETVPRHPAPPPTPDELARFWAHANQLREEWARLPACVLFLLGHDSWQELPRIAADLRSWFILKLDFRQAASSTSGSPESPPPTRP